MKKVKKVKKIVTFTSIVCVEIDVREGVNNTKDLSQEELDKAWEELENRSSDDSNSIWSIEEGELEDP